MKMSRLRVEDIFLRPEDILLRPEDKVLHVEDKPFAKKPYLCPRNKTL